MHSVFSQAKPFILFKPNASKHNRYHFITSISIILIHYVGTTISLMD